MLQVAVRHPETEVRAKRVINPPEPGSDKALKDNP